MRRFLTLAAAIALAAFTAAPSQAQIAIAGLEFVGPAGGYSNVVDTDVALYVKYVGSTAGKPTVEVASNGDITFKIAGSVDATVGCPTIGTGIIDVSHADCNTFIEVINKVHGQSSNWLIALGAALGSDSSDDSLLLTSATDASIRTDGAVLYYDTNYAGSAPFVTILFGDPDLAAGKGSFFFQGNRINPDPFKNLYTIVSGFVEKKTSGGTIADTVLYAVRGTYDGVLGSTLRYSETVRELWRQTGGATATQATGPTAAAVPLVGGKGEKLVLRIGSTTTISAQALVGAGYFARARQ